MEIFYSANRFVPIRLCILWSLSNVVFKSIYINNKLEGNESNNKKTDTNIEKRTLICQQNTSPIQQQQKGGQMINEL